MPILTKVIGALAIRCWGIQGCAISMGICFLPESSRAGYEFVRNILNRGIILLENC